MKYVQPALIYAFLLFTFGFSVFAQDESRASKTWEVQKYDLTATVPQAETDRFLTAKAVLNLKNVSSAAGSRLTLRISKNAEVAAVKVNGAAAEFSKGEEKVTNSLSLQRIIVRLPSIAPNQTFAVEVEYKLKTEENSGLHALSPVGSQFLPLSYWYPTPNSWYFARGADFAPFNLTVSVPNDAGISVISSGGDIFSSGKTQYTFQQKLNGQPFFVSGKYKAASNDASGVTVYMAEGAEDAKRASELQQLASEAKNFVAGLLGNAPDTAIQIVPVRRGAGFSSGGTILVDESVFRRQKLDSQTVMNIAEAVAKIWLGNATRISGDGYGVIQEGLSRFIATQFLEQKYGKEIADVERLRQRTAYAAVSKRDAPLNIVSPIDDYYYPEVANKGAMIWRLLARRIGQDEFFNSLRANLKDGNVDLAEMRSAFSGQKEFLDYAFEQVTDMNLLVGLPQQAGADTKVALRNTGAIDAVVSITATMANGEKSSTQATIPAKSFGEAIFKTSNKIVRVEIDAEKFYPQTEYSDDVAPREYTDSDAIIFIKREFDRQNFANAEKNALTVLRTAPRFDDARIFLARALLGQGKTVEAEREFRLVLDEKLPTARSLAWANVGLGEIALKTGQKAQAGKFFEEAIRADAEYGASLAARQGRNNANISSANDEAIKNFFAQIDKAAVSGRKADLDGLIVSGEIPRFSAGISGQAQQWQTKIVQLDKIDANNMLVEASLNIKLLNKNEESGTAVFRVSKVGNGWKLSGVEMFEVR